MGRAGVLRAVVAVGLIVLGGVPALAPPVEAESWVKTDMGKGYDATAQGGLYGVALGDGDRDGNREAYASCYDNGHIYEYRRDNQQWSVKDLGVLWPGRYPRADAILVGDGDDDGRTEVYASGFMYTTGSLINSVYQLVNGTGGWTKSDIGASGGWGTDLAMGDGNGDGRTELYSSDSDGHIYQYSKSNAWNIQDIGGAIQFYYQGAWHNPYMKGVEVGDGDNDGRDEVYGAASDNHVYRFKRTGSEWERADLGLAENTTFPLYGFLGIAIGDADNDRKNEVYAASYVNGTVWRYRWDDKSASWNVSRVLRLEGTITANDLCIGDGNSDGKNEVYVGTSNKQLYQVRLEGGTWKNTSVGSGNGAINGVAVGAATNDTAVLQLFAVSADGHCYEYFQDIVAPANPVVWSDSHPVPGNWYDDRRVHVLWKDQGCDISGIDGYSALWDGVEDTIPDRTVDYEESTRDIFTILADGCWYFHIRTGDNAFNWNPTAAHYGPVLIDTTPPDAVRLEIDGGADLTNSNLVSLSVNASDPSPGSGVARMAFSNDGGNWSEWEAFCATRAGWDLTEPRFGGSGSDGTKTVFARVQDRVGREVPADRRGKAAILLDRLAPEGLSLSINGGACSSSSAGVRLYVQAHDPEPGSGITKMGFSNDGATWSNWTDWLNCSGWSLAAGAGGAPTDGRKTVFFRAQDRAGNIGGPVNATIILDTGRPRELHIVINGGAMYASDPVARLDISAADPEPGSPPMEMALSATGVAPGSWEPFASLKTQWNLTAGPGGTDTDGLKTVWLWVRDAVGNTAGPVSGSIFLDRIGPGPLGVTINAGANRTNRPLVELALEAADTAPSSGIEMMQLSDNGSGWTAWEPFSPLKRHSLSGPDGRKTVLFRVRDRAGNVAEEASASIMLDSSPPAVSNLTVSGISNVSAIVSWATDEPSTCLLEYGSGQSFDRNQSCAGYARNRTVLLTGLSPSTTYRFRLSLADEFSNNATSEERNFTTLETSKSPPAGPKPAPVSVRKDLPIAWAAVPLLIAGCAAGLLALARARRRKVSVPAPGTAGPEAPGTGTPETTRSGAVDWGPPEQAMPDIAASDPRLPVADASPPQQEQLETLVMDDDAAAATGLAGAAPGLPAGPGPPVPAGSSVSTVRCTGCGAIVTVHTSVYPVRILCHGCGKSGLYRGPVGSAIRGREGGPL